MPAEAGAASRRGCRPWRCMNERNNSSACRTISASFSFTATIVRPASGSMATMSATAGRSAKPSMQLPNFCANSRAVSNADSMAALFSVGTRMVFMHAPRLPAAEPRTSVTALVSPVRSYCRAADFRTKPRRQPVPTNGSLSTLARPVRMPVATPRRNEFLIIEIQNRDANTHGLRSIAVELVDCRRHHCRHWHAAEPRAFAAALPGESDHVRGFLICGAQKPLPGH